MLFLTSLGLQNATISPEVGIPLMAAEIAAILIFARLTSKRDSSEKEKDDKDAES